MAAVDDHEAELARLAGQHNALEARIVSVVRDVLADGSWSGHGIRSPRHWLTVQLGCSPQRAGQIVDVAGRLDAFPTIGGEFARGALSFDQAHTVVTRAPSWADAQLVNMATSATVPQLRTTIRDEYFEGPDAPGSGEASAGADAEPDIRPVRADRVSFGWDGSRFGLHADVDAETGAILEAALEEARDALFRGGLTDVTWADSLREVALRSLDQVPGPRRDQFKTMLHVDVDDERGAARFTNGVPLPASIRDYLTCGCDSQAVWERDHLPIGVGRTQRSIPIRLRVVVERRDKGCRVPGCSATHVEIHHIVHWRDGGETETYNLVSLCAHHHRLHHRGQLGITGDADDPDGLTITDATGKPIRGGPRPVIPIEPPPPAAPYEHPSGERLQMRWFAGWTHPVVRQRHAATWHRHRQRVADQSDGQTHKPEAA